MKASTQYNDLIGTVSADTSDAFGGPGLDGIKGLVKFFNLNEDRFKPIGISFYGTKGFTVSLICIDKEKSKKEKEHIVSMSCSVEDENEIIDILFKRLHIVLHNNGDDKYPKMKYDEEVTYNDYH